MNYEEWLQAGRPSDTLFYVERDILPGAKSLNDSISDLCGVLRVVDMYVMSKHEAMPIKPEDALLCVDGVQVCSQDHRRIFTVYVNEDGVKIAGRQYYEVSEDSYDEY